MGMLEVFSNLNGSVIFPPLRRGATSLPLMFPQAPGLHLETPKPTWGRFPLEHSSHRPYAMVGDFSQGWDFGKSREGPAWLGPPAPQGHTHVPPRPALHRCLHSSCRDPHMAPGVPGGSCSPKGTALRGTALKGDSPKGGQPSRHPTSRPPWSPVLAAGGGPRCCQACWLSPLPSRK